MRDPRELMAAQAEEIADSDTIPVLRAIEILGQWGEALMAVLDYADDLNKVDLYAAPAHCLRTLISAALEAK